MAVTLMVFFIVWEEDVMKKSMMIAGILAAGMLILCAGCSATPEDLVKNFSDALNKGDGPGAVACLSQDAIKKGAEELRNNAKEQPELMEKNGGYTGRHETVGR
jgi:hypothetical protein